MTPALLQSLAAFRAACNAVIAAGQKATARPWEATPFAADSKRTGQSIFRNCSTPNASFIAITCNLTPDIAKAALVMLDALDELSKLGNKPLPGNSLGNMAAQRALQHVAELTKKIT